jgi:predicted phage terminase large subunit-like protein
MGEFNFSGQYQQNPMPKEGGVIKKNWLKFYDRDELFKSIEKGEINVAGIIQSWDTANKVQEHNDYSVCITLLRDTKDVSYVLDVYREKLEFPALIRKIAEKHNLAKGKYKKAIDILIEDQASGTSLIQALKTDHQIYSKSIKPEYDKQTRLISVSHLIENGKCLFPSDKQNWWMDFEQELLRFPKVKHDDQCDALSQALQFEILPPLYVATRHPWESNELTKNFYSGINWKNCW